MTADTHGPTSKVNVDAIVGEMRLIRDTQPEAVALVLDGLLKIEPEHARANLMRGQLYQKESAQHPVGTRVSEDNFSRAIKCFRAAVKTDPDCPIANSSLGRCLFENGQTVEAEPYLRKAYALEPGNYLAAKNLGFCLTKSGKYSEAVPYLRQALTADTQNPALMNGLGYALCALADQAKKEQATLPKLVDKTVETGIPSISGGIHALLTIKDEHKAAVTNMPGLYKESETLLQIAVAKNPANAVYRLNLGWTQAAQGKFDDAEVQLQESVKLDPTSARTFYYLAQVYTAQAQDMMDRGLLRFEGGKPGAQEVITKAVGACVQASQRTQSPTLDRPNPFAVAVGELQYHRLNSMSAEIKTRLDASVDAPKPQAA